MSPVDEGEPAEDRGPGKHLLDLARGDDLRRRAGGALHPQWSSTQKTELSALAIVRPSWQPWMRTGNALRSVLPPI